MERGRLRAWGTVGCMVLSLLVWRSGSQAISLDSDGDIKLGARAYVNARVGTEDTHEGVLISSPNNMPPVVTTSTTATFPYSPAGHLRQNRGFIEIELNHSLDRLVRNGVGPFSLLNDLPFKIKGLSYNATFRGEADSLYDWGPREYSTASQFYEVAKAAPVVAANQTVVNVPAARQRLRRLGTDRERLFQAFLEGNVGNLFVRIGRQNLSWGETDAFQLLDHINPIDSSFGGFLISLDERRIPLDMVVANYYLGDFGPFTEAHLEGFGAFDNNVGYYPGTPAGSPWALPSFGGPPTTTQAFPLRPAGTFENARGGFQLKFNALDATFGLAHYYTYFDTPAIQVFTRTHSPAVAFDDGLPCKDPTKNNCGYVAHAYETAPKVQVTGASTTFALPQWYSVVRSEFAYFKDEPAFTQGQLDPFLFTGPGTDPTSTTGGRRVKDSINAVVGLDTNQWIRALNANQTFFISTQFFYKHINGAAGSRIYNCDAQGCLPNPDREVLPVYLDQVANTLTVVKTPIEPVFVSQPRNQYLQTLFIGTSYRSGTINPGMTVFYDWGGAFLYQPSIQFSRDPFRFSIDYSIIDAHIYKGGSGISLLKDRDNVQFRLEYVI
jgi:hypothetical protein